MSALEFTVRVARVAVDTKRVNGNAHVDVKLHQGHLLMYCTVWRIHGPVRVIHMDRHIEWLVPHIRRLTIPQRTFIDMMQIAHRWSGNRRMWGCIHQEDWLGTQYQERFFASHPQYSKDNIEDVALSLQVPPEYRPRVYTQCPRCGHQYAVQFTEQTLPYNVLEKVCSWETLKWTSDSASSGTQS
jgi:hypothetical protein